MNNLFQRKWHWLIQVKDESQIKLVEDILKSIDEDEFDWYYPAWLVRTEPDCIYVWKYEVDENIFYKKCFEANIVVRVVSCYDENSFWSLI